MKFIVFGGEVVGYGVAQKIISAHLVAGEMKTGGEIGLKIDQTLTQDATGTMAYLEFEAMGIDRVKTELSVAYIDHNTLQTGFENADDHRFIRSVARKRGIVYSHPGNGICHQVHLERFSVPGKTLIGSDSHTPTCGGIGMLAMGAGGLDVAVAMGGGPYFINMPSIVNVVLTGELHAGVSAKDIILAILSRLSVKGGVDKILEYSGEALSKLSVPERATITNMGAELGATASIFPSDTMTRQFLESQARGSAWVEITADPDAVYDEQFVLDLSQLEPLAAMPHMPDNVKAVREIGPIAINQVCIGSCTNSSFLDMMKTAAILKGKKVHDSVSLTISPGSRQVLNMLALNGALSDMISAGARILETACGPCIGMGQAPETGGVSLRTFNRNFKGRSGTPDAEIYLVSPETAAVSAISGVLTVPGEETAVNTISFPQKYITDDNLLELPLSPQEAHEAEIVYGPNIKPYPATDPLPEVVRATVAIKVGDNITTDHIMPAGASILPYRSNIPYLSGFCFRGVDKDFADRCTVCGAGIIVGGHNYGQGSSREHAALVPLYLGIKVVIAKSFSRIHAANLINAGILPLVFADEDDYERINGGDILELTELRAKLGHSDTLNIRDVSGNASYTLLCPFTDRQREILLAGGLLNYTKSNNND